MTNCASPGGNVLVIDPPTPKLLSRSPALSIRRGSSRSTPQKMGRTLGERFHIQHLILRQIRIIQARLVLPVAAVEGVFFVVASAQIIVAGLAEKLVSARAAVERVVSRTAVNRVVAVVIVRPAVEIV